MQNLMVKEVRKGMRGGPGVWALRLSVFTIDFLRFEVYFSCSVWVLRRDSISAHVWYGLRINLNWCVSVCSDVNSEGAKKGSGRSYVGHSQVLLSDSWLSCG